MENIYNPYCLVCLCTYEATKEVLLCEKCILRDGCKDYEIMSHFRVLKNKKNKKG